MRLNLRQAMRRLWASPLYTIAAVVTLGLGVAATTAAFAMLDTVVVRPLPFRDAERLVWIWATHTDRDRAFFSVPDFRDLEARNRTLDEVVGLAPWGVNLTVPDGPAERLSGARLSPAGLSMLGAAALHGRTFAAGDDPRVVVLGNGLWRRRFGGDPAVVGRSISLDGDTYTVVGVLDDRFILPNVDTDVVAPFDFATDPRREQRGTNFLRALGRLGPKVTLAQARDDLAGITRALAAEHPDTDAKMTAPRLLPLSDELVGGYRGSLLLLAGAVVMVLVVACANFTGLALARLFGRQKELMIRAALGATRAQLAWLLVIESALLAVGAGVVGTLASPWAVALLRTLAPADLPRAAAIVVDGRALAFAVLAAAACAVLVGIAPALRAGRERPRAARRGLREALIVVQLAASLVLLVAAGLLARGAARLAVTDPGFEPRELTAVPFSLPRSRYATPEAVAGFHRTLAARAAELPGVSSAATASLLPLSGANARTDFIVLGRPPTSAADMPGAQRRFVGPGYFETLGVAVRAGRRFTATDDGHGQRVVIVDQALARRFLAGLDPVGAHLVIDDGVAPTDAEIVGVVADVAHFGLGDPVTPTIYVPIEQLPQASVSALGAASSLLVRTRPGSSVAALLPGLVFAIDAAVAVSAPRPMTAAIAAALAARHLASGLVLVFAIAALLLAATGLGALVAASVAQRTREIGLRMALGGTGGQVVAAIVGSAARLVGAGVLLGGLGTAALILSVDLGDAGDALPFAAAAGLLAVVGLAAAWIPARRAATVDPAVALRAP